MAKNTALLETRKEYYRRLLLVIFAGSIGVVFITVVSIFLRA